MTLPAQNPYSFSQSVGAANKAIGTIDYLQNRKAKQEATQQKSKEKAQGQIRQIFGSIDMDGPEFYDHMRMAAGWFGKENPEYAQEAVEIANLPEPELKEWAKSNKKMLGTEDAEIKQPKTEQLTLYGPQGATKRIAAEKGKDFTPEEGWSLLKPEKDTKVDTGFGKQFTGEELNEMADVLSETGKYEFTGRSMEVKNFNAELKKRSLERQKQRGTDAVSTLYSQLDKKGMTKDIDSQQKKLGSMRSFTKNIDKQAEKIHEVANRLFKMDTKILNHPVNKIMRDYIGSADRAVLQLLVGELSEEIGKLASGATDSVAALSEGGREKWDKIYDTNLSTKDMLSLVDESKELAKFRVDSMKESLSESRAIRKGTKKPIAKTLTYNPVTGGFD